MEQRPKWLTGADLIQELHLTPGPEFRRLLTAVEEAAFEGTIKSREEAVHLVKSMLQSTNEKLGND